MSKVVAIHQPNYLPAMSYFDKMGKADLFIIYDTAQMSKNSFTNRNRIISNNKQGWQWLTVSINKQDYKRPIKDVRLSKEWFKHKLDHYWAIFEMYPNHKDKLEELMIEYFKMSPYNSLSEINMYLINWIRDELNIKTDLVFSSELGVNSKGTEALIELTTKAGGDCYLSGLGGKNYLEEEKFADAGIKLKYQSFEHSNNPPLSALHDILL